MNEIDSPFYVSPARAVVAKTPRPAVSADRLDWLPAGRRYVVQALATSLPLALADAAAVSVAFLLLVLTPLSGELQAVMPSLLAALVGGTLLVNGLMGLYPAVGLHPAAELRQCSLATTAMFATFAIARTALAAPTAPILGGLALIWVVTLVLLPVFRAITRQFAAVFDFWAQPVLIFGGGAAGAEIYRSLQANRPRGLRPIGIVDKPAAARRERPGEDAWYVGSPDEVPALVKKHRICWSVLALPSETAANVVQTTSDFAAGIPNRITRIAHVDRSASCWQRTAECGKVPVVERRNRLLHPGCRLAKRLIDLSLILATSPVVVPLVIVIALLIRLTTGGPAFYRATRYGFRGRKFVTWKFRTMVENAEEVLQEYLNEDPQLKWEWEQKQKLTHDPRVFAVGRILRQTSLDELPQLISVLTGTMSLVGPRPIVDNEIARYGNDYHLFCQVRPGITGLWQVSGRNDTTYEERVELDAYYARNWSPWLDLFILARTCKVVVTQEGAY